MIFFHMNQIGDFLFSLPVLYAFKKEKPEISLISVIRKHLQPLVELCGVVDKIITRPSDSFWENIKFISTLYKEKPAATVLFSESLSNMLSSWLCAFYPRVGFKNPYSKFFLTNLVERNGAPSLNNNKKLGEFFGLRQIPQTYCGLISIPNYELSLWLENTEDERLKDDNIVILAPRCNPRRPEKLWDNNYWAVVLDFFSRWPLQPVLIGTKEEKDELIKIKNNSKNDRIIIYAGHSLKEVAILLSKSKYFIGIDSGIAHLASVFKIPMVVLYGATDPAQIGPQHEEKIIIKKDTTKMITPTEVITAFEVLMKRWN